MLFLLKVPIYPNSLALLRTYHKFFVDMYILKNSLSFIVWQVFTCLTWSLLLDYVWYMSIERLKNTFLDLLARISVVSVLISLIDCPKSVDVWYKLAWYFKCLCKCQMTTLVHATNIWSSACFIGLEKIDKLKIK